MGTEYIHVEEHSLMRDLCTCPHCDVVWTHYEQGPKMHYQPALDWIHARYSTYQCPECGTWSALLTKRTFRHWLTGTWREVIGPEADRQPKKATEQEMEP